MSKTCLKCGNMGHNSRSCSSTKDYYWSTHTLQQQHLDDNKLIAKERSSLRLFGVQLLEDHHHHDLSSSNSNSNSSSISVARKRKGPIDSMASHPRYLQLPSCLSGYQPTIDINRLTNQLNETKYIKRVEWSEEEHRRFLEGIEKLGKGDWRGISRHYVTTRSPIQIASHAQNYFLRLEADANQVRRRRPSRPFYMQMQGEPSGHMSRYKPNSTDDEEASIDHINPYDRCPEVHHSTPPRDLRFNNVKSSFQSASAAAEGLDLDLKLAASYY